MRDVLVDLSCPHEYDVQLIEEISSGSVSARHIYFPNPAKQTAQDGLMVKVMPSRGETWTGTFAFGYASPEALSAVLSVPDARRICVVSAGDAYVVSADDPEVWEKVESHPITSVRLIPESQLLVFADLTKLTAYGYMGRVWQTSRLSWDGLKILEVTSREIKGMAWDSPNGREVEFVVCLETGSHEGGSSPEV